MKQNMDSKPTSVEEIENAAAQWLLRRDAADWTPEHQAELDQWLQGSPSHRVAYIRLQSVWKNTPRLKSVAAGLPTGIPAPGLIERSPFFALKALPDDNPEDLENPDTGTVQRKTRPYALAASILLGFLTAASAYYLRPTGTTYTTPIGGMTTVPTKDGSTITLNTASQIRVQLTETERRIDLSRGEAFFEVAHDPTRPFIVNAGNNHITAIGTKFSVLLAKGNPEKVRVIVTEGTVRLEEGAASAVPVSGLISGLIGRGNHHPGKSAITPEINPDTGIVLQKGSDQIFLPAGTIALASGTGVQIHHEPLPEVEQALSWRTGYVVLTKTPLADAVREFNRYNTRQLILDTDPALQEITIGGNFRTNNLDGFLRLLEQGFNIQATADGDRIVLHRK
jgi:transmembrane sensor